MTEPIKYGKFYTGMTKKVAEEKNKTKHFFERDYVTVFDEIDINKNGVLEENEICYKKMIGESNNLLAIGCSLCSIITIAAPMLHSKQGKRALTLGLGLTIADIAVGIIEKVKAKKYLNDIKQKNETKAA